MSSWRNGHIVSRASSRRHCGCMLSAHLFRRGFLLLVILAATALPASARMLTTNPSASASWSPLSPLIIGGGIEYETDSDQTQYDFPLLLEYSLTEELKFTVEPTYVSIHSKSEDVRSVTGFGDLETSVEYEFLQELRYRPALSAKGIIKWPTAADPDLGTPGKDYSLGLIMSKDLVYLDLDFNMLYTFVGDPEQQNIFEISMAVNRPIFNKIDIEAEVVHSFGGSSRGQPGSLTGLGTADTGGGDETEGTLGIAWHVTKHLKLEGGGTYKSDGSWQAITAWEYSFSGED